MNDSIQVTGKIRLEVIRGGKVVHDTGWISNIVTNVGKAAVAGLVGNTGGISAFTYLAVGTSNTAVNAADTTLGAEISTNGLARAAATVSRITTTQTNDTLQLNVIFSSVGSFTVQEMGVLNAASTGILLAHALTGAITIVSGDQLNATHAIKFA